MIDSPCLREARLYQAHLNGSVRCGVCERTCLIPKGGRGFCGSRVNVDGKLHLATYGALTSVTLNPIEKKPLFHYWPGSKALSGGSWGCNLRCVFCQNYELSMVDFNPHKAIYTSPGSFVALALDRSAEGLSFTFNEASCTLFEYILECFRLAAPIGLYLNLNTNGYMTTEALDLLIEAGLDSMCVDIKGDKAFYRHLCNGADPEPVWRNTVYAKGRGLHVEMVNLVIPGANDGEECIEEIITRTRDELGRCTPLHFSRFYPAYRAYNYGLNSVTPINILEGIRNRALEEELQYVYIGNVPGHVGEDTYCPRCGRLLIDRYGFSVVSYQLTGDGRCPECRKDVPIVGKFT